MGVRLIFISIVWSASAINIQQSLVSLSITRHHNGDMFLAQGTHCEKDLCVGLSSGTAGPIDLAECTCKCMPNLPIFRDDLNICVDDIQECMLAPFVSGTTTQKIPFVFLPLKGQIVYPSAEITFSDVSSPICVVSGAQFLARGGWIDLRNGSDTEPPFRLFRDEGRTYLQWLGEGDLRNAMEGRLILVHLMCKDASESEQHKILTPCVAFRVAGNPSVREMIFSNDVRRASESPGGLSVSEYVAIAVCSILLGLIYVASVFLYIHLKKRKRNKDNKDAESAHLTVGEEGVIKNNPLLQPGRRHHNLKQGHDNNGYSSDSGSCCSDSDDIPSELAGAEDEAEQQNIQTAAVIVHPYESDYTPQEPIHNQDPNGIECIPQEDVSIVETLENREDRPETVQAMTNGNVRRKLYFNPAYFDIELLKTPPPAAVEFLMKIREVIAIAKHKMSAKRFSPSLIGIPEEEIYNQEKSLTGVQSPSLPVKSEMKKEDRGNYNSAASGSCCPSDTKQRIIRKWLEDVPTTMKLEKATTKTLTPPPPPPPPPRDENKPPEAPKRNELKKPSSKGPAPPRPPPPNTVRVIRPELDIDFEPKINLTTFKGQTTPDVQLIPKNTEPSEDPDLVPRVQGKDKVPPAVAKTLMDAVIQELVVQKKIDPKKLQKKENTKQLEQFESDSLERKIKIQSPIENTIESQINPEEPSKKPTSDDHDYEVILLSPDTTSDELKIYNLPEILAKNEGYSLVSEVYVNDGYSFSSGESSSIESLKTPPESRLTILVKDSPENYKKVSDEEDNFEPDTLDRKPGKMKIVGNITNWEDNKYSNQKFHDMDLDNKRNQYLNYETFMDSLERPQIMLKSNGSFRKTTLEEHVDELLRKLDSPLAKEFSSLREIYEMKSKNHCMRTETTSLVGESIASDTDCQSTHSWSEDRRNKLLHRGIVLHSGGKARKRRKDHIHYPDVVPPRPPKPSSLNSTPQRSVCHTPPPPPPPRVTPTKLTYPFPPPPPSVRSSRCTSPMSRKTSPCVSPIRSICASPTQLSRSACTSPLPKKEPSPPLPPRNTRPPLPPKNAKSTRQKKPNFARRPLPPLPARHYHDSTISSVSSRDIETLSTLSGASMDSLNSSDYEAFYTLPYDGHEGEIYDKAIQKSRLSAESMKRSWKKIVERSKMVKPEDSGYLSTDSNESHKRRKERSASESEESVCDGASESGAESTATDSFFFGDTRQIRDNQMKGKGMIDTTAESKRIPILIRH